MAEPGRKKAVTDLSQRVVSLARRIDRLPPGEYTIKLEKPDRRGEDWGVQIVRTETILDMLLDGGKEDA